MTRLARNVLYNLGGQLALLVLGLVSARHVFAQLGGDVLGIIYFTMMLNALALSVLQLGITATTVREISAHENDRDYTTRLVRSGALFYWAAYVIVGVAMFVVAPYLVDRWITLDDLSPAVAVRLLRILGISALLAVPQSFYASVFRGLQRMGVPNLIDVASAIFTQVGIVAIISLTRDAELAVWWMASNYVVRIVVWLVMIGRAFGWSSLVPKWDASVVGRTKRFTLQMTAVTLLATLQTQTDKFVIASMLPVGAFGVYALMYSTVARGSIVTSAVAQSAFPALSELVASGDRATFSSRVQRLHDLLCYGLAPLYALLAFAAFPLFTNVFDVRTAGSLLVPACLLALGYYLNGMLNMPYYVALATERPDIVVRLNVLALVTTLPVTVFLTWRFGFVGAAGSWVWYHVFAFSYFVPRICRECLGSTPRAWFLHAFRVFGLIAVTYGVAGGAIVLALPASIPVLLAGYALASVVFAVLAWRSLVEDSREALRGVLRSVRGRR